MIIDRSTPLLDWAEKQVKCYFETDGPRSAAALFGDIDTTNLLPNRPGDALMFVHYARVDSHDFLEASWLGAFEEAIERTIARIEHAFEVGYYSALTYDDHILTLQMLLEHVRGQGEDALERELDDELDNGYDPDEEPDVERRNE